MTFKRKRLRKTFNNFESTLPSLFHDVTIYFHKIFYGFKIIISSIPFIL